MLKVLSSKKCVPCYFLKEDLKKHGIDFIEVDIESPEGLELAKKFGLRGVPAVIEGDKLLIFGYNQKKVEEMISKIKNGEMP